MTRAEHVKWCKARALEYLDQGDAQGAYGSMVSDMGKHEETAELMAGMAPIGMMELMSGPDDLRRWIEGFAE